MAASTARWQLLAGEVKRQASWFLQDKYKQARLALGDVTPAEL
jgi:epsin